MQTTSKELYKEVASTTNKDIKLIKSIGDTIFIATSNFFKYPPTLIGKLKGIGFWYMRRKMLDEYLKKNNNYYNTNIIRTFEEEKSEKEYKRNKEQFDILIKRQVDYNLYKEKKEKIKAIRYQTQELQKPKNEE